MQLNLLLFALIGIVLLYGLTGVIMIDAANQYPQATANQTYIQDFANISGDLAVMTGSVNTTALAPSTSEGLSAGMGVFGPAISALKFFVDLPGIATNTFTLMIDSGGYMLGIPGNILRGPIYAAIFALTIFGILHYILKVG
jgi:hypothetical protein